MPVLFGIAFGISVVAAGLVPACADAACLTLAAHPDGGVFARYDVAAGAPEFTVTYVHSVTRTPVTERYRVDGDAIVQTQIRFAQHGPGLPTLADAGGTWTQRDGEIVATMQRRFDAIVMRVHADQRPRLAAGGRDVDLAAWGNRAVALRAAAGPCSGS